MFLTSYAYRHIAVETDVAVENGNGISNRRKGT